MKTMVAFEYTHHPSCPTACPSDNGERGKGRVQGRMVDSLHASMHLSECIYLKESNFRKYSATNDCAIVLWVQQCGFHMDETSWKFSPTQKF